MSMSLFSGTKMEMAYYLIVNACLRRAHNGTSGDERFGGAPMHTPHDCATLIAACPLFSFSLRAAAALYLRGRSRWGRSEI